MPQRLIDPATGIALPTVEELGLQQQFGIPGFTMEEAQRSNPIGNGPLSSASPALRRSGAADAVNALAAAISSSPERQPGLQALLQRILPAGVSGETLFETAPGRTRQMHEGRPDPLQQIQQLMGQAGAYDAFARLPTAIQDQLQLGLPQPEQMRLGPGDVLVQGGQPTFQAPFAPRDEPRPINLGDGYVLYPGQGVRREFQPDPEAGGGASAFERMFANQAGRQPTLEDFEASQARIADARRETIGDLSQQQMRMVESRASSFDQHPTIRQFNETSLRAAGVEEILRNPNWGAPADMAMIFDFMRVLDPTSVVRETEFRTAAEQGNPFLTWAARFNRYIDKNGAWLSPTTRENFAQVLRGRIRLATQQVEGIYKDFGRRIDQVTGKPGSGTDFLTPYHQMLPTNTGSDDWVVMTKPDGTAVEVHPDDVGPARNRGYR